MTYLPIALAAVLGPLYAWREWKMARRENLVERIRKYGNTA